MRCGFNMEGASDEEYQETFNWLKKRSLTSSPKEGDDIRDHIHEEKLNIEFIETPRIASELSVIGQSLSISSLSESGVTFYLVAYSKYKFSLNCDFADGFLFVPMSNIKAIDTCGGRLRFNKEPK